MHVKNCTHYSSKYYVHTISCWLLVCLHTNKQKILPGSPYKAATYENKQQPHGYIKGMSNIESCEGYFFFHSNTNTHVLTQTQMTSVYRQYHIAIYNCDLGYYENKILNDEYVTEAIKVIVI